MSALEEPPLVDAKSPLVQDSVSTSKGYYALSGKGLGLAATVAFIIGEMAGGGILALPQGVVQTGYIGTLVIVLAAAVSGYTGVLLGDCWGFLLKHWPAEYASSHVRHPYPAIGLRATGMWMHHTVAILVDVTLFGVSTVFLLLTSENLADLFPGHLNYRIWIIIVAAALIPLAWLESPKDAFWIAIAASAFTAVASIIVFTLILIQGPSEGLHVYREPVTFESFCLGIATIVFAFGGHASFPTYQHDMKDTSKFWLAVIISYVIILLFYVPVSAVASEYFLNTVAGNVLQNLSSGVASKIVKWMFTFHIFCGFIIVLNPVAQDVERLARVPQAFGIKRIIVRSALVLTSLGVAQAVPCFDKILQLIGSSTVMLLSYIFPSLFYLQLSSQVGHFVPLHIRVLNYEIIVASFLAMIACTYSAVKGIIGGCEYAK